MNIKNLYRKDVFWRIFDQDEHTHIVGKKEGTLTRGQSTSIDIKGNDFIQIEFKEVAFINVWGSTIQSAGPIFSTDGDIVLQADGVIVQNCGSPILSTKNTATWMSDPVVQNKTLREITLPASHDSATSSLSKIISEDTTYGMSIVGKTSVDYGPGTLMVGATVATTFFPPARIFIGALGFVASQVIDPIIRGMAVAQSKTIWQQLNDGIRVLDLRVVKYADRLNTSHALVGAPISMLLDQVNEFLKQTSHEIVILLLGIGSTVSDDDLNKNSNSLVNQLHNAFGNRVIPWSSTLLNTPIRDITLGQSKVLIVTDSLNASKMGYIDKKLIGLYGKGVWAGTSEVTELKPICKKWIDDSQSIKQLVSLSWVLTPDVISTITPSNNLEKMAKEANLELEDFMLNTIKGQRVNIIFTDYYDSSKTVALALKASTSASTSTSIPHAPTKITVTKT